MARIGCEVGGRSAAFRAKGAGLQAATEPMLGEGAGVMAGLSNGGGGAEGRAARAVTARADSKRRRLAAAPR